MAVSLVKIGKAVAGAAKSFVSGSPVQVGSRILGAATAASLVYDSHINGRERAYSLDEVASGDRLMNMNRQYMQSNSSSATVSQLKKGFFYGQMASPCFHFWTKIKGYAQGFGQTVINNLPRIGLCAATLLGMKSGNKALKTAGTVAGGLLAADWVRTLAVDVLGIGSKSKDRYY
jgi:hypothetical protein